MSSILGGDPPKSDSNVLVTQPSRLPGIIMMVLVVLLIGATGYLYYQLNQTRTEVAQMRDWSFLAQEAARVVAQHDLLVAEN